MRYYSVVSIVFFTVQSLSFASHSLDLVELNEAAFAKENDTELKKSMRKLISLISKDSVQQDKTKKEYLIGLIEALHSSGLNPGEHTALMNRAELESDNYSKETKAAILKWLKMIQDRDQDRYN